MTKSTTESKLEERKNLMKAMQYQRYGGPSELRLAEIPRPVPIGAGVLLPFGPPVELIALLRIDLADVSDLAGIGHLFDWEVRQIEPHGKHPFRHARDSSARPQSLF